MKLRNRYAWLIVDGHKTHLIILSPIKDRGRELFTVPEEFTEFLGLRGIEIVPATNAEAAEHLARRVATMENSLQRERPDRQMVLLNQ
jgi:hypothetical protein